MIELLSEAYGSTWSLHTSTCHVSTNRKWLLVCWQLLDEYFSGLFVSDKLANFLCQVCCFKLVAHLSAQLKTLAEMEHVHVVEDLLFLIGHHAQSNCIKTLLVHISLEFNHIIVVHDRLALRKLIVVLRSKVLQRLPILLAENLMLEVEPDALQFGLDLCQSLLLVFVGIIFVNLQQR